MTEEKNKKLGKTIYLPVNDYCALLNESITKFNQDVMDKEMKKREEAEEPITDNDKKFPWIDTLSDHLPIILHHIDNDDNGTATKEEKDGDDDEYEGIKIVSWNINNKKHGKWLQKTVKNEEQRLWWIDQLVNQNEDVQLLREKIIAELVVDMIKKYDVVALQEVSGSFIDYLNTKNNLTNNFFKFELSRISYSDPVKRKIDNCNMIIYNTSRFRIVNQHVLLPVEYDFKNGERKVGLNATNCVLLQHVPSGKRYYFASVHLNYNSKVDYVKIINEMERKYPMFIAGDFNKGVRHPMKFQDKHMKIYSNDCFKFPSITHCYSFSFAMKNIYNFLPYSHVCPLCNVESEYHMLDRYDHIVYVLPNK